MNGTPAEQRLLFERLCLLRELYQRRGPRDRDSSISIGDAINAAQLAFAAAQLRQAALHD
jgi:hypothetical protein